MGTDPWRCPGVLGHAQSHVASASRVPHLLFQTFIFTDGEDEELKKQARESVALGPLCVTWLSMAGAWGCAGVFPQPGSTAVAKLQKKESQKMVKKKQTINNQKTLQFRPWVFAGTFIWQPLPGVGVSSAYSPHANESLSGGEAIPFELGKQITGGCCGKRQWEQSEGFGCHILGGEASPIPSCPLHPSSLLPGCWGHGPKDRRGDVGWHYM